MELDQLFNILKLICNNATIHNSTEININDFSSSQVNECQVVIFQFKHWCYTNKFDFNSIRLDIFQQDPTHSLIYKWFKHNHAMSIYNSLVDIVCNAQSTINHTINYNNQPHRPSSSNMDHHYHHGHHQYYHQQQQQQQQQDSPHSQSQSHSPYHHGHHHIQYNSYSSSNIDSDDQVIVQPQSPTLDDPNNINMNHNHYNGHNQIDIDDQTHDFDMNQDHIQNENNSTKFHDDHQPHPQQQQQQKSQDSDDIMENHDIIYIDDENHTIDRNQSYYFQVSISQDFIVKFSIFEFILSLNDCNLSTLNAVWQKIEKNEDDLIGEKKSLCLCLHILICIAIQNKYKISGSPSFNEYNKFQQDPIYGKFLDSITTTLCEYFLDRQLRTKMSPSCLALTDNTSKSPIVMGFGDLVDELPKWLIRINQIILNTSIIP